MESVSRIQDLCRETTGHFGDKCLARQPVALVLATKLVITKENIDTQKKHKTYPKHRHTMHTNVIHFVISLYFHVTVDCLPVEMVTCPWRMLTAVVGRHVCPPADGLLQCWILCPYHCYHWVLRNQLDLRSVTCVTAVIVVSLTDEIFLLVWRQHDNTVEENASILSLIQVC